jgi:hypothetical protein
MIVEIDLEINSSQYTKSTTLLNNRPHHRLMVFQNLGKKKEFLKNAKYVLYKGIVVVLVANPPKYPLFLG